MCDARGRCSASLPGVVARRAAQRPRALGNQRRPSIDETRIDLHQICALIEFGDGIFRAHHALQHNGHGDAFAHTIDSAPVDTRGGGRPAWARNGRELFYLDAANTLTAVPVQTTGSTFSASNPAKVFDTKYTTPVSQRTYDVSPDGQRFLMIKEGATDEKAPLPTLVVVEHWFEELKRLVPAKP